MYTLSFSFIKIDKIIWRNYRKKLLLRKLLGIQNKNKIARITRFIMLF